MRVVITGGSGFIGSHLCDRFIQGGHEVFCLDNYVTGSQENTAHLLDHPNFHRVACDVAEELPVEPPIDRILHMASPASPVGYMKNPIATLKVGSLATFRCAELARQTGARLLLASTSEIYGDPQEHPQKETYWGHVNPIGPRSVYDEAKRFSESVVMAYHREFGVQTRIARLFNTYGPRMQIDDGRALPAFLSQALRGDPITVFGDGSQTRSFCYVSDTVEGICRLLKSDSTDPVNIGNPAEITIQQLAEEIIELTGSKSKLTFEPLPQDDPLRRQPDISRAKDVLDWQPVVDRREGLQKTLEYFRTAMGL